MKKTLLIAAFSVIAVHTEAQKLRVKIETDHGTISGFLYDNTPLNAENMRKVSKEHTYDSTLFHRVIPDFMIQGGDPDSKHAAPGQMLGNGGLTYTVPAEINDQIFHKRGVIAAARDNNPSKAGSSTQFYIVVGKKYTDAELDNISTRTGHKFTPEQRTAYKTIGGTPFLDGNYTVFGEVTDGMDVVEKIINEPRDSRDRPNKDVRILKLTVKKKKKFLFF